MIAFALLGIGTLLVLLGIVFNFVDGRTEKIVSRQEKNNSGEGASFINAPQYAMPPYVPMPSAVSAPTPSVAAPIPTASMPFANMGNPAPQADVFVPPNNFQTPPKSYAPKTKVNVVVSRDNPKLFQKEAYLYIDQSQSNSYMGEDTVFSLQDVGGIRRIGLGKFSYDGFSFFFHSEQGNYRYTVENLNHIAFYPNCVVLVASTEEYPALLFTDETKSIRKALETFKIDNE